MNKVVITGATGSIGSSLARRLVALGYTVYIISRKNTQYTLISDIINDVCIFEYDMNLESLTDFFQSVRPDVVFHLASLYLYNYDNETLNSLLESNIRFPTHVLEAMKKANVTKLINTGSHFQNYEGDKYAPVCLYAATKESFEKILEYYVFYENFSAITLKLYDTYGPNDKSNKIINLLDKCAKTNEPLDMSHGEQKLSLVYIDDVIDAFLCAKSLIEKQDAANHMKYFISSGESVSLRNIVKAYEEANEIKLNVNWGKKPYRKMEIFEPYMDGESLPGWSPKISLENGLKSLNLQTLAFRGGG